jgi:hypothetical protein
MKSGFLGLVAILAACGGNVGLGGDAGKPDTGEPIADAGADSTVLLFDDDPTGWFKAGANPADYVLTQKDTSVLRDGKPTVRLESMFTAGVDAGVFDAPWAIARTTKDTPAVMYRGKRVRMRADLKVEGASVGAWLWFRIDAVNQMPLKNCNMINPIDRRVKGTSDFQTYSCVLDVPDNTETFAHGFGLSGPGKAWIANVVFEAVGPEIPESPH